AGRAPRVRAPLPARALGRYEAARGHRAGAGPRRAHPAHGRALRGAGRADAAPDGRVANRHLGPDAEDRRVRDPQPPGGDPALPAHRGDDGATGPDQGELRGVAPDAARPRRGAGRGPPARAVGRDPRRVATRAGRRGVRRIALGRLGLLAAILIVWELWARHRDPLLYVPP